MRRFAGFVMVALGVTATVLSGSTAAWAHDEVSPATVVAGEKVTVTVAVANEGDLPSDGVELRVPPGFAFRSAEDVPGWRTEVVRRADGTATAVRWTGGRIEPGALSEYVVTGGAPSNAGSLVWAAAQKPVGSASYVAAPVSEMPHMTVTAAPLTGGAGSTAQAAPVPLAASPPAAASTTDGVARSRATLALVLAGLALLGVVAFGSAAVLRSRPVRTTDDARVPPAESLTPKPARSASKRDRQRAMSSAGGSRR